MTLSPEQIAEWNALADPRGLLRTLHARFGDRLAIGTSGQLSGGALIALCEEAGFRPRVFTNDTGRLFPETLDLFKKWEKRFGLTIERFTPDPDAVAAMTAAYGEHLFFDSKERQELCCRVRKVEPNERALRDLDAWVTGLRWDQSPGRSRAPRVERLERVEDGRARFLVKAAPLVDWTEARVRGYLAARDVPVHALLDQKLPGGYYYESLGCVLCTTPIGPAEPRRAGRWRWFNTGDDKKECGLHLPPPRPR